MQPNFFKDPKPTSKPLDPGSEALEVGLKQLKEAIAVAEDTLKLLEEQGEQMRYMCGRLDKANSSIRKSDVTLKRMIDRASCSIQ